MLAKKPGFTLIVVLTLAIGIGANTAMFSIVNGVLLNPLPYSNPDRIAALYESTSRFENGSITYPNFLDWQRNNRTFESMAAYRPANFTLTDTGEPERVKAEMISAEFFSILGVKPLAGRTFTAQEDLLGGAPVALISEGFSQRKFGSAADALGRTIKLDGVGYQIIGIIPARFQLQMWNFRTPDVYTPIGQWSYYLFRDRATAQGMDAIGRLKPGVTLEQACVDMDSVTRQLAAVYPQADAGVGAALVPLKQNIIHEVKPLLLLLLGAVCLVLLIACVNVANLLLARSTSRSREFGIRSALGASGARIVRQLITESILLAIAGGALGLLFASLGIQGALLLVQNFHPQGLPRAEEIGLDLRVLGFTMFITLLVGVLFGLVPALKMRKADLEGTLREGARGSTSSRSRAQNVLVVSELAMALVLLAGAGLMIRCIVRLWSVNPGFDSDHVLTFYLSLSPSTYSAEPEAIQAAFRHASETIASVPGVESVSLLDGALPMQGDSEDPFWILGRTKPFTDNDKPWALWYEVQPNYLKAMGTPLLRGRFFNATDTAQTRRVAVIDETFAEKYFPDEDPIGKSIVDDYVGPTEVVGVIGHVKHWGLDDKIALHAQMYFPFDQIPGKLIVNKARGVAVVVRTQGSPASAIGPIREALTRGNSQQVVFGAFTMKEVIAASLADRRFLMTLLILFAAVAHSLASVGIYGVLSYFVAQRIPEIGIRLALGAQQRDVLRLILSEGMRMTLVGVVIGLGGALALSQLMTKVVFGISAADPVTFAGVAILLAGIALLASYVPARRAMNVDPIVALRHE
jgi:putative ABC transport system permease protein